MTGQREQSRTGAEAASAGQAPDALPRGTVQNHTVFRGAAQRVEVGYAKPLGLLGPLLSLDRGGRGPGPQTDMGNREQPRQHEFLLRDVLFPGADLIGGKVGSSRA